MTHRPHRNNTRSRTRKIAPGLQGIEILHVDTVGSQSLYAKYGASPKDKADCQQLLRDLFRQCCTKFGGVVRQWSGDGGFAFFPSCTEVGSVIAASTDFLENIPSLNAQTAVRLESRSFYRSVRLKAHRGEIFIAKDSDLDSADPKDFDAFLKGEKRFAPKPDELFITAPLYDKLDIKAKKQFELYTKTLTAPFRTSLYRLKRTPTPSSHDIFLRGDEIEEISDGDWRYLRSQVFSHKANVATRNLITKGIIDALGKGPQSAKKGGLCDTTILTLTLRAMYNYLRAVRDQYHFRVSYWRAETKDGSEHLKMVDFVYPEDQATDPKKRIIAVARQEFALCQAFKLGKLVATPSVVAARNEGKWVDFDNSQKNSKRDLASALQLPVYYYRNDGARQNVGVVCLDSDKPDMFLVEEVSLWQDDLVGFLVNIALAERLRSLRSTARK